MTKRKPMPKSKNINTSLNLFPLPLDVLREDIIKRLHIEGPAVELIRDKPSENQKKAVIATNTPALTWSEQQKADYLKSHTQLPDTKHAIADLSTYHLIEDSDPNDDSKKTYAIGFCAKTDKGEFVYRQDPLEEKSSLLRYITENPSVLRAFKNGRSQDRYLMRYMEHEIRARKGLIGNRFANRARFAGINQQTRKWMNGLASIGSVVKTFNQTLKQDMLNELIHYVDYPDELDEDRTARAKKILQADPSLLLSDNVGTDIQGCTPDRRIKKATAFQLAVYNGDWPMWEMMLDVIETHDFAKAIPQAHREKMSAENREAYNTKKRQYYKQDLFRQLEDLEKNGLEVVTDNLLNKGVRILDADVLARNAEEAARMKQDVIQRNAYQLIIETSTENSPRTVKSCKLAFHDPASKENKVYREITLSKDQLPLERALELYDSLQNPYDGHGWDLQHMINRDEDVLSFIEKALASQNIKTQITKSMAQFDYRSLQADLDTLKKEWIDWSHEQVLEQWHVPMSAEVRQLPDFVYRILNSMPFTSDKEKLKGHVGRPQVPLVDNYFGDRAYPRSRFLGHNIYCGYCGTRRRTVTYMIGLPSYLKIVCDSRGQKLCELKSRLTNQPVPYTNERSPIYSLI